MLVTDSEQTAEDSDNIEIEREFEGSNNKRLEKEPRFYEQEYKFESSPPDWCDPLCVKPIPFKRNKRNETKIRN